MEEIALKDLFKFRFGKIQNSNISLSQFDKWLKQWFYGQPSTSGEIVNEETAMKFGAVSSCVYIISNDIGLLPLQLRRYKDVKNPLLGSDLALDHPLFEVLTYKANNMMTSFNFKERMMSDVLLTGNSYSYKEMNLRGQVTALKPLDWQYVEIKENEDGSISYYYKEGGKGDSIKFTKDEILHVSGYGNGFIGKSPVRIKMDSIGLGIASEKFAANFYKQGLNVGGVITLPGKVKDKEGLRKELHQKYEGLGNAHKALILEDGMTFTKVVMPLKEAQFIETRQFQATDIASWYRMPPKMVQDHRFSTYSNNEQQDLDYSKHTLLPWTERLENFFNCYLLTKRNRQNGLFFQFDYNQMLKSDSKTRAEVNHIRRQDGIITGNEWRNMDGLNPRTESEADMLIVNGNMRSIEVVHNDLTKDMKDEGGEKNQK